ncbi:MAG TPA: family 16 glycoside hydrolase, partial [Gemmata sp.]|nr:family 16 glycoside hydrolase [Gemmata sp.]
MIRSLSEIEKRNRDAIDGNRLKDIAKAVHDVGSEMEGFVPLFNGKDLTGWKVFPEGRTSWNVKNGILVGSGKPSHLFTERGDFGNFHLRMETRVRKSGAKAGALGVFARVPLKDPGMIISPHGESGTYRIGVPKLYDPKVAPPDPAPPSYREKPLVVWGVDLQGDKTNIKQFSADEWFTHELIVDGKNVSIQTKQGNQSSHSFIFAGAQGPPTGHIALQLFDDWSAVEFRKIEIKELPPTQQSRGVLMVLRARGNSAVYDFPGELTTESPQELTSHLLARVGKNPGLIVMLDTGEGFDLKSNVHANMLARAQALITATGARAQLTPRLVAELSRPAVIAQKCSERSELLRQIGIATHGYSDTHGSLPPAKLPNHPDYFDAEGRPHLSWRVHILPFLDQEPLYKKFHLNEPWDSEHNKKLLAEMPAVFKTTLDPTKTTILSVVGEGTAYEGKNGLKMADIAAGDGTSSTAYVVDVGADKAVPWTKPQDMQFDAED